MTPAKRRHVILAYMDESGEAQYGKKILSRPHFLRSCVLVREDSLKKVESEIRGICRKFPISSRTGKRCRFHAAEMYWGTGDWKEHKSDFKITIGAMGDILEVIVKNKLSVTFGHINKPKIVSAYKHPIKPAVLTFMQCGHIVEGWMRKFAPDQRWMPCVGHSDYDRDIEEAFHECRKSGSPICKGVKWEMACDIIGFTSPRSSDIFAISDLCAFMFSRKQQGKDDWTKLFYEFLEPHIWKPWVFNPS
jgi:hypothetical protein